MAKQLGLRAGTPVSAAIIDAHAGVPGAGAAEPGVLVMVMGTSSCHMLNAESDRFVPGVSGVVKDGILPGYFGYETGQAAVGDAFDWLRRTLNHSKHDELNKEAAAIAPGADGVRALDWMNGCRTPLMDGRLTGAFTGLTLHHSPAHLYRALMEGSAFGLRWIVDTLAKAACRCANSSPPAACPTTIRCLVQIYADVLGEPITVHPCKHGPRSAPRSSARSPPARKRAASNRPPPRSARWPQPRANIPARRARVVKPSDEHSRGLRIRLSTNI